MKTRIVVISLVFLAFAGIQATVDRTVSGNVTSATDGTAIPGVNVVLKGTSTGVVTDIKGHFRLTIPEGVATLVFSMVGYVTREVNIGSKSTFAIILKPDKASLREVVVAGQGAEQLRDEKRKSAGVNMDYAFGYAAAPAVHRLDQPREDFNTEEYNSIHENIFHTARRNPLSTFSIDVDAASYSNVRRFINEGQLPPKDAVRIEEMINYFHYDYPQPKASDPFAVYTEIAPAPWNEKHKLVHIGLQGRKIPTEHLPASNLVFLVDVSGSMSDANKLPLLKSSFKMLVAQLREQDRVAIVVYAGAAGLVLPSTAGNDKETLIRALDNLQAGGSTAGGDGIRLAYAIAKENFRTGGNNRVILATDGDFNIGESSNAAMERLIEEKLNDGIFLTVLGFGMGNYKDSKMETLADKGNGNYAYIDTIQEAQKVLVNEFGGTLFTIAKDVKLQVEFNPARVKAYRLIGYENRMLQHEDFKNDKKDAGDLGSGHTVTALYEIVPAGVEGDDFIEPDTLHYQMSVVDRSTYASKELMTIKLRYKRPDDDKSSLIVQPVLDNAVGLSNSSVNFRWSAAVAGFGMILRGSEYVGHYSLDQVIQLADAAKGKDSEGYRIEFVRLAKASALLARQ
jgi:Ca-activated chloride channel family protein